MSRFGSSFFTCFALALASVGLKVACFPTAGDASSLQRATDEVQFLQVATNRIKVTEKAPAFRYEYDDNLRLLNGKQPRVLLYTWCDENGLPKFANEFYWKGCYAHMHGFDVVISSVKNFTGVKKIPPQMEYHGPDDALFQWYHEDRMWAWAADLRTHLSSGKYDYVFVTGGDVLINKVNLGFPVWAYDTGHDITIMDQDQTSFGFNENAMLFKASSASVDLLNEFFEYRKDFWVQSDNGAWMEFLLQTIGRDAKTGGYNGKCASLGKLDQPASYIDFFDPKRSTELNTKYADCFFQELDRLAGKFGQRSSQAIGFSKAGLAHPDEMPWANCFSYIREAWPNYREHCLAFHWNGPKGDDSPKVDATCPDPFFKWDGAPTYDGTHDGRIHLVYQRS